MVQVLSRSIVAALALAGCAQFLAPGVQAAEPLRISGLLQPAGDVTRYSLTASGSTAVFVADAEADEVRSLYAVPVAGGGRIKLSGDLAVGEMKFSISRDGNRVVFEAQDGGNPGALYSVAIGGGEIVKISGTTIDGGWLLNFAISADSARVVFLLKKTAGNVDELYSVAINGTAPSKVSGPAAMDAVIASFAISPDSARVVYYSDADANGTFDVFSVPISGGTIVKVSGTLAVGGNAYDFAISPDSDRVVFRADKDVNGIIELYSVAIADTAAVKISGPMTPGGDVVSYKISPKSGRVLFLADKDTDDTNELYSVAITGGAVTKLSGTLPPGNRVSSFEISAADGKVVYQLATVVAAGHVFSTPTTGGSTITLTASITQSELISGGYAISRNGNHLVFALRDPLRQLWSVPLAGGTPVKLTDRLESSLDFLSFGPRFAIIPDSSRVVFVAARYLPGLFELYSVPVAGGAVTKHSGAPLAGTQIFSFAFTADSTAVVFQADKEVDDTLELYSAASQDPGTAMDIDGNGSVDALTDGLLMLRWQFGLRGAALITGVVAANATRTTSESIEAYLEQLRTHAGPAD